MLIAIDNIDTKELITSELSHDIDGNLILYFKSKYYYLDINHKNELEWIEIHDISIFPKIDNVLDYSTIKNTYENETLRKKIIEEIDKETEHDGSDSEVDMDEEELKTRYKFLPEEKLYYITETNSNHNVIFAKSDEEIVMCCLDWTLNSTSLYDFLIFADIEKKLIAYSSKSKTRNHYRVLISQTGQMTLNVMADKITNYVMKTNSDFNLLMIKF